MAVQKLLVLLPALACFLAFSWGTLGHFRPVGPIPLGMRLIGVVSVVTITAFGWSILTSPLPDTWPAAPILSIASLALFAWAARTTRGAGFALAFAEASPSKLLLCGPFHYMRHPFYTSYLLFWLATYISTNFILCSLGFSTLLICYFIAARKEERCILRGRLAAEYASYMLETGVCFPRRKRWRQQALGPEIEQTMDNEYNDLGVSDLAERIRLGQLDMLARLTQVMALTGSWS